MVWPIIPIQTWLIHGASLLVRARRFGFRTITLEFRRYIIAPALRSHWSSPYRLRRDLLQGLPVPLLASSLMALMIFRSPAPEQRHTLFSQRKTGLLPDGIPARTRLRKRRRQTVFTKA